MQHIISDVHGCYHTLLKLIDKVRSSDGDASFIFIGDYVDRGLFSKDVVEYVIEMQKQGAICLKGNHDNVVGYLLNGNYDGDLREMIVGTPTEEKVYSWWLQNGFGATLKSYGVDHLLGGYGAPDPIELFKKLPELHKQFFQSLQLYWTNDTHFCCHAHYRIDEDCPRSPLFVNSNDIDDMLWTRFERDGQGLRPVSPKWSKIGVFGHTPTTYYNSPTPIKYDKIRLIDTCAFLGNYMCAYNVQLDDWILQATAAKDMQPT